MLLVDVDSIKCWPRHYEKRLFCCWCCCLFTQFHRPLHLYYEISSPMMSWLLISCERLNDGWMLVCSAPSQHILDHNYEKKFLIPLGKQISIDLHVLFGAETTTFIEINNETIVSFQFSIFSFDLISISIRQKKTKKKFWFLLLLLW